MTDEQILAIAAQAQFASLLGQATIDLLVGTGGISPNDAVAVMNRVVLLSEMTGNETHEQVAEQARRLADVYSRGRS